MIEALDAAQVDYLLRTEAVGRIGCHDGGKTYVVPVAYAYDGTAIYVHSADGEKLTMMRAHPAVCFEIDRVQTLGHWQSVIARGRFEELHGAARVRALELLRGRFMAAP